MGQVLSEGEVDALLKGVNEGEVQTESDQPEEVKGVTPYDLTSQEKIIAGRLPTLDIINQMFSRLFRQTFSGMLRKAAEVNAVSTDTVKFGEFLRSLPSPSRTTSWRGSTRTPLPIAKTNVPPWRSWTPTDPDSPSRSGHSAEALRPPVAL